MFTDQYIATITLFAGNFEPLGWRFCNGQTLSINEYSALYALIGTIYGGDGVETFMLPDLRSRVAVHAGQGPGLESYLIGDKSGQEQVMLIPQNVPSHTHALLSLTGAPGSSSLAATTTSPADNVPAVTTNINTYAADGIATMAPTLMVTATPPAGNPQPVPVEIVSPVLALNFIIAVEGIFPSRN